MKAHEVRRIPIVDGSNSGKSLEIRIKELCDLMGTAGFETVSISAVEGQILILFSKDG